MTVRDGEKEKLYRLPLDFGPITRAMRESAKRLFEQTGKRLLPLGFRLGINDHGAFAIPDVPVSNPVDLVENPPPPVDVERDSQPWRYKGR